MTSIKRASFTRAYYLREKYSRHTLNKHEIIYVYKITSVIIYWIDVIDVLRQE